MLCALALWLILTFIMEPGMVKPGKHNIIDAHVHNITIQELVNERVISEADSTIPITLPLSRYSKEVLLPSN